MIDELLGLYEHYCAWFASLSTWETVAFVVIAMMFSVCLGEIIRRIGRGFYYERKIALPHKELLVIRKMFHESENKEELKAALDEMAFFLKRNNRSLRMQITKEEYDRMLFENLKELCVSSFEFILEEFERSYQLPITRRLESMERVK